MLNVYKGFAYASKSTIEAATEVKISQNSQENTCTTISFLIKLQVDCHFIKK